MYCVKDVMIVKDLDAIKTLSDPLRLRILELLIDHQATTKQVSTSLGLSSANIHYHVKELERLGLIRLVDTVEKGGILEKYYRAVANNYYVDHSLGKHDPDNQGAAEAFSHAVMRRRLEEQLQVDLEHLCDRIVHDCLVIKPGEVVRVSGGFHQQDLLETVYEALARAGARPVLAVSSDRVRLASYRNLTEKSLVPGAEPLYGWLKDINAVIEFDEFVDPGIFSEQPAELVELVARRNGLYGARLHELGIRRLNVAFPTRRKAEALGIDFSVLYDSYWRGLDVDYNHLRSIGRTLRERIRQSSTLHITGPFTDLTVKLAGRRPWVDDGVISPNDLAQGHNVSNLPAGEVCVAPLEGTAEGKALFHSATYRGQVLRNIMMEFRQGEVVSVSAEQESDAAPVRSLLFLPADDDRRKLGVFSIGFNPALEKPLGYSLFDYKVNGVAHISVGGNGTLGGTNVSAITWGFLLVNCRVEVDGQAILENGRLLLD